jgi:hypothetical protein
VLGQTDLDGDDVAELFVRTASGVRDTVALFRVVECEAVSVTLESAPAEFAVGASVTATGGLQCGEGPSGTIRVYAGESADGENYDITWRDPRLAGTTLTQVDAGRATAPVGDELVRKASTFACG